MKCCGMLAVPIRVASLFLIAILLSACVSGRSLSEPEKFKLLREGQVPVSSVSAFADCLLDGFDKAHFVLTNSTARTQRRSDSYRVETLSGGRLLKISVDVFDDGRVQLFEAKAAALVNTSGERDAFEKCLEQYGTPRQ